MKRYLLSSLLRSPIGTTAAMLFVALATPAHAALQTSVTQYGITWNFSQARECGQFITGDWWVVGPVTISSVSPTPTLNPGRNGSMLNVIPAKTHGYDDRPANFGYSASKAVTFPITLQATSSLISTSSHPEQPNCTDNGGNSFWLGYTGGCDRGQLNSAAILTVVSAPVAAGTFRPPYAGSTYKPMYTLLDVHFDRLPRLALPASATLTDPDQILRDFERPWIDHLNTWYIQNIFPNFNMHGYGRELGEAVSYAAAFMMLDHPDVDEIAIRVIQHGIDYYGLAQAGGYWAVGGGFGNGRKFQMLFAAHMLDDATMMNNISNYPRSDRKFGEDCQTDYDTGGVPRWGDNNCCYGISSTPCGSTAGVAVSTSSETNGYRTCCTSHTWPGQMLATLILGLRDEWNWEAWFDYTDRWVSETGDYGDIIERGGNFMEPMWLAYRTGAPVSAPSFNPGGGTYSSTQSVAISTTTDGATIRYTTNGTTPSSTVGTVYSGPVSISATTTLRAIAYKSGMSSSTVTVATYTISPTAAAPTFNPGGGTYTSAQSVAISTTTGGATIRYTTNGTTPSPTVGTVYSGPVSVGSTTTLRAIAYGTGLNPSSVTVATYTITNGTVATAPGTAAQSQFVNTAMPSQAGTFSVTYTATPSTALMDGAVGLSLSAQTAFSGLATIVRFNTSGRIDARNGGTYAAANVISYSAGQTYAFRLVVNVATHTYSVYLTPPGGSEQTVGTNYAFRTEQAGVASLNNWAVAATNPPGGASLTVNNFAVSAGQVAAPTFSPGGGTYTSAQSVAISTTTGGATIRYTTNGTTPSPTVGTVYSGPVSIGSTATLRAIAYLSGMADSTVTTATYTINSPVTIIVDNTAAEYTGTWTTTSTYKPNYYGSNYSTRNAGTGTNRMRWRPTITSAGTYAVYYWLPDGGADRGVVSCTIYYNGGSQAYSVDQRPVPGGQWILLGSHSFAAGTAGYVEITDDTTGSFVIGDAVRFVKP